MPEPASQHNILVPEPSAKTGGLTALGRWPAPADTDRVARFWHEVAARSPSWDADVAQTWRDAENAPAAKAMLDAVAGGSPYLSSSLLAEPAFLGPLLTRSPDALAADELAAARADTPPETDRAGIMRRLRLAKRRLALIAALADIGRVWPLMQVTGTLADLADLAIDRALDHLLRGLIDAGEIAGPDPAAPSADAGVFVLAMGKHGARELNYSSDIDLIVFFDPDRVRYTGRKSLPERYVRLTRDLCQIIQERTDDGYVFRVDLRLRPDAGATAPAISVEAALRYYESQGQNWERAAMIKARVVGGDRTAGDRFLNDIVPFIWRRYLDFAAIDDIQSLKRQVHAHKGHGEIAVAGHDIKVGRGGIREIELFAQTQQLILGGRHPRLRAPTTIGALSALTDGGHLSPTVAAELSASYEYLRTVEHRIQMVDDAQTQRLPQAQEDLERLALFLGHDGFAHFDGLLRRHLGTVSDHYSRLFERAPELSAEGGNLVFTGTDDDPDTLASLTAMGYRDPAAVTEAIRVWHRGRFPATRSERARQLLTELMPMLLPALARGVSPNATFARFNDFLRRLPAGVQVFSLFLAKPDLLKLVSAVMGEAPRLADRLSQHSGAFDSMISPGYLGPVPNLPSLRHELAVRLDLAPHYEEVLNVTRRWNRDRRLQVGVKVIIGRTDGTDAGRDYTNVAEAALQALIPHIETEFARTHGRITGARWSILGLGKVGSREMTPESDLDLVFIYDVPADAGASDGEKSVGASQYFARLSQRVIAALTALMADGTLYAVDMRLRPSGAAGPVAVSLESWLKYQTEAAWFWEHMALVRGRPIAGDRDLAHQIEDRIADILRQPRDFAAVATAATEMRDRLNRAHPATTPWDLKHAPGGRMRLDAIAQTFVLAHAQTIPELIGAGTETVFGVLATHGLIAPAEAETLTQAARIYTEVGMLTTICLDGLADPAQMPPALARSVSAILQVADAAAATDRLAAVQADVEALFDRLIAAHADPGAAP